MHTPNAKLISKDSFSSGREILLTEFPIRIGRAVDSDVVVGDRWVSREHCEIECDDVQLVIRDLDSKYGTFINGEKSVNGHCNTVMN